MHFTLEGQELGRSSWGGDSGGTEPPPHHLRVWVAL